ncbi:BTAD domain-containing putative transcriptional regulator [Streptomyces sp. NPDC059761]|uniref:AfsR/SARP family transcriptional regulator n=1 Tax=Streptomyces sp. NPDC059761 TaxID=3346937 RepID=UPI00364F0ABA
MGPVEAWGERGQIELPGSKITTVLAALVLSRGRVVPDSVLADLLWGEAPPATARAQIQTYTSRLRGLLGPEVRIDRQRPGYRISSKLDSLDLIEFERLTALGRNAMAARRPEEASDRFGAALALWRGPALAGVSAFLASVEAPRLEEARLVVLENRIDADLELGRHAQLVTELMALVTAHPHRERPRAQLMQALHHCGRRVEALEVYREYRQLLVGDLGLEPGGLLQDAHHLVLSDEAPAPQPAEANPVGASAESAVDAPTGAEHPHSWAPVVRPAQLPRAPVDFTGRQAQVEEICAWMTPRGEDEGSPPVCAILGLPGIGKTALGLYVAHRLRSHYPDGQILVDLGAKARSADPNQVLREVLLGLGVDASAMPECPDELTRLYRSCVSGRRLLIAIGGAVSEEQVRPLLPGTSGCGVMITSRGQLAALEGVHTVSLKGFDVDESLELLGKIVGHRRMSAEPEAAARIVELCGRHPLALRISGARLVARPHWSLERLAGRLADQQHVLEELILGDLQVREGMKENYLSHRAEVRSTLLALSVLGTSAFSLSTAATAVGLPEEETQNLVDELVDSHLVEVVDGFPCTYRLHRLTWALAREVVRAEGRDGTPAGKAGAPLREVVPQGPSPELQRFAAMGTLVS